MNEDRQPAEPGIATATMRRISADALMGVRASDMEPYIGLRYLSKLFRFMAIILILVLIAEVATGLIRQGMDAVPVLLREVSRLIVLGGLLWGSGDLAMLLIDIGHDVRATRILIGRQAAHHVLEHHSGEMPVERNEHHESDMFAAHEPPQR